MKWIEVFGATTFRSSARDLRIFQRDEGQENTAKHIRAVCQRQRSRRNIRNPDVVDFKGRTSPQLSWRPISRVLPASQRNYRRLGVSRLNDYLSEVSETLIDNGAFINKYIGDAILAVFGAFGDKNHQRNACLASLEAMRVIERKIREAEAQNLTPFITRMGVTTGKLSMGNIGSNRKLEFTVIGDTVNSAFRLEGINKYYSTGC